MKSKSLVKRADSCRNNLSPLYIYMIISILQTGQMRAQSYFEPASLNETTANATTVNSRCIGNDIMNVSGNVFRVSVWDDLNSGTGIAWECDYQGNFYSGIAPLQYTSDIIDPDVAITTDGTVIHALVGYHDVGSAEYYLDVFTWRNTGTWEFVLSNTYNFFSGALTTTMNVDADDNGGFVIALHKVSKLFVFTGSVSTGVATFNNSGTEVFIDSGSYPDLCVFNDGNDHVVHLVYVDASGDLIISTHDHADLASGSGTPVGTPVTVNPTSSAYSFHFPRIACPAPAIGTLNDWTVVTEESNGSAYKIVGFNDVSAPAAIVYNDNNNAPINYDITGDPNHLPAVSYDDQYNVWVGWIFNNLAQNYGTKYAIFPIVLKCDYDAQITSTKYWEVPTFLQDDDEVVLLALSGRYGTDEIYVTYYSFISTGGVSEEIYNKMVIPSAASSSLKTIQENIDEETVAWQKNILDSFDANAEVLLTVFDLSGRMIWSRKCLYVDRNSILTGDFSSRYPDGIYLLKISGKNHVAFTKFSVIH